MQFCHISFPTPTPDMEAIVYFITHSVISKTKYYRHFKNRQFHIHQNQRARNTIKRETNWRQIPTEAQS